jgi:hypothetical protein
VTEQKNWSKNFINNSAFNNDLEETAKERLNSSRDQDIEGLMWRKKCQNLLK